MSSRIYPSEEFRILLMTQWQEAQAARTKRDYRLMKSVIERMVVRRKPGFWMFIAFDVRLDVSEVLFLAGKECNACMACDLAIDCFSCAIEILGSVSRCERSSTVMSAAIECLVNTNLQNGDLDGAQVLLDHWNRQGRECISAHPDHMADVTLAIGRGKMELGLAFVKDGRFEEALDYLTPAVRKNLRKHDPEFRNSESEGIFASALGNCLYMESGAVSAFETVRQARLIWKSLNWPFEHVDFIVPSLKVHLEYLLSVEGVNPWEENEVRSELLMLNYTLVKLQREMLVPSAFTTLGIVAVDNKLDGKAVELFEQAYTLHKRTMNTTGSEESRAAIRELLMFIGLAQFNSRNYTKAASAYLECLPLLEKQQPAEEQRLADCCASLGLTYSALFDYNNMMFYYERAFHMETLLPSDVRQLVITNMGHLYYVKAVKMEREGQEASSSTYHVKASEAYQKARDEYPFNSVPYVNYGYYLFRRGDYFGAVAALAEAYHNAIDEKDTIVFDRLEEPILIEDLRHELRDQEFISIPTTIISLYLKTLAQIKMGNVSGARDTAGVLQDEVYNCNFADYSCEGFGPDNMKQLSKSLLRYVRSTFREVANNTEQC
ncbi:hypothetical protein CAPTEDRAFT_214865 [Capitella teleta]|uniref:Uncharacterized protein n=1 Tax=Capitella teleta TaxID=283909 RepID=R7UUC9_CAPTE|nr:hypothetical protein CAPTEDRAFT_214865 [Capitella teleta]|eukprot:ELU06996.1 hypothetical protein CAPTEDRAFT_214865 [Capitella teleta]